MPSSFKLIEEKEVDKEWLWTYLIKFEFTFNYRIITKITITDHTWKKKGREWITKGTNFGITNQNEGGKFEANEIWWCSRTLWARNYSRL